MSARRSSVWDPGSTRIRVRRQRRFRVVSIFADGFAFLCDGCTKLTPLSFGGADDELCNGCWCAARGLV